MRRFFVFLLLLVLIGTGGYFGYLEYDKEKKRDAIVLYGNVDIRQVDTSFRVAGRVTQLYFEEGDLVEPGMLLAELDKQPYLDLVAEAAASVESVKASLENAKKIYQRRVELIEDGSISQEDLDTAAANVEIQIANVKQAKASLEVAKCNLAYTRVFAPTQATILTRVREPGTVVGPGDPVFTLSILSPVWIRAFVSERELGLIYPGMKANITTDTPGGTVYKGQIGFISPVAEFTPKTVETVQLRTDLVYRLRIYVDNPDRGLRQGMPVTVTLPLEHEAL